MNKTRQMAVFLFCLMFASTNIIAVLAQPITSPVIVTFGTTEAETAAIGILQNEYPNAITVRYGSIEYFLIKGRCFGPMVFVGHGTADGIGGVDASTIILDIKTSPVTHTYLLACGSNEIAEVNPSLGISGFGQMIDAEIGAYVVAIKMALSMHKVEKVESIFDDFIDVARSKISGEQPILPLAYLSNAERDNFFMTMLISVGIAVIGTLVFAALASRFSIAATTAVNGAPLAIRTSIKNLLIYFATHGGIGSIMNGINTLFGGVIALATQMGPTFVSMISLAIAGMNFFEWILWVTLTVAEIVLIVVTATLHLWYRIGASLVVALANVAVIGITDYNDPDGTPCTSVFQAISQLT